MSGLSSPNTSIGFHVVLLGFAALNVWIGIPMLSVPLVAWVAARWIVMGFGRLKAGAESHAVGGWNGRHYSFDGRQLRIHWDDAGLWVEADDLFRILDRRPDAVERRKIGVRIGADGFLLLPAVGRDCFSEAGVFAYLACLPEAETRKLRRWLEREVFPNIRRIRELNTDRFRQHRLD